MLVERTPITFTSAGQKVFGVVHRPTAGTLGRHPGVALLHGLVGSKDQPHQLFVKLGDALAASGAVALRIDFRGRGDSEGLTVDMTPEGDLLDAQRTLDWLQAQPDVAPDRLGVLGLSWGGSVAAIVAGRDARVKAAVLWNAALPAFDWRPPLREVDGRLVVELFGNLIGEQFYQQARGLHVAEELRTAGCPFLVVQSSNDEVGTEGERRQFRGILAACRIPFAWHTIQGADHALMRHDWEREAIQVSVEWLGKSLSVPSP